MRSLDPSLIEGDYAPVGSKIFELNSLQKPRLTVSAETSTISKDTLVSSFAVGESVVAKIIFSVRRHKCGLRT